MTTTLIARWDGWKMDGYAKGFILAALLWLSVGTTLGLTMAGHDARHGGEWGGELLYRLLPSHAHLLLLGWVSMLIFGVGYHLIPRIAGTQLWSPRLGWWHFWTANAGLIGMAAGFYLKRARESESAWYWVLAIGGTVEWVSVHLFVVNLLMTLWRAGAPHPVPVPPVVPVASGMTSTDTPAQVIARHPEALDVFLAFGFHGLADPEHLRTMGSRITVAGAARRHGVDPESLLSALNAVALRGEPRRLIRELPVRSAPQACCSECAESGPSGVAPSRERT